MDLTADNLRLLGGLLATPGSDSLETVKALVEEHGWLSPAVDELSSLPLDQWQGEHTQLFLSGYPKTPCPPFESAYRNKRMNGPACSEVEAFYQRAGLQMESEEVPADYIGTELECAAWLLDQGEQALWEELRGEHLSRWIGKFAEDLKAAATLKLYRSLGEKLADLF